MKLKICIISTPVFQVPCSGYSGLEVIAWECAKGLAAKGHEVSLVAPDGSYCPGVTVVPCGPAGHISERDAYSRYWEHLLKVDAIIDHSWQKMSYLLRMEGRLQRSPIGVCHAPISTMYSSLPPVDNPCFVCISQDQCNHFNALFSPREARVAYNGIDLDFYRSSGRKRTDRYLFLARFSTIKGPDLAIEACKAAGVGLDLVGDFSFTNEPDYLNKILSMADGKQIRFVGQATRAECVHWFSQAHCLLHPNQRFREPFGLAPVEAMSCGTPCIAFDYGAMRETVAYGETGYLVKSLDKMVEFIKSNSIASIDRDFCREWVSQWSVQKMCDRYEELVNEALATGGW